MVRLLDSTALLLPHAETGRHMRAQVRTAATATLQTAVVSAEVLGVLPGSLERGLREWMLPPLEALSKKIGGKGKRDLPQVRCAVACTLQNKCLCYLAENSHVTWLLGGFLAGIWRNIKPIGITQARILQAQCAALRPRLAWRCGRTTLAAAVAVLCLSLP
jgi:hypothetical protein